jgi:hypothetical protein
MRLNHDADHLRLLSIFHYIVGGLAALASCVPLIHVFMGFEMVFNPSFFGGGKAEPPTGFGWIFVAMGLTFCLIGWACSIATVLSGRFIARRKHRLFSFVTAAVLCAFFPFGTALGVFTIIMLSKESVQALYAVTPPASDTPAAAPPAPA